MTQFETWLRNDLKQIPEVTVLDGNFFSADRVANRIGVIVTDNGEDVVLSDIVTGYVIRPDNESLFFEGASEGNRCWIDLTAACYSAVGPISIVIKVGATTVGACTGYVYRTLTDEIIDPGHVIPSIEELLEKVDEMIAATEAGIAAANLANQKAAYADQMATEASRVNVDMQKNNKILSFTATNRNGVSTTKTSQEPTLKVTKSGITVTLTATDADGTTEQSFTDASIDDAAGAGDTESIWSADKIVSELNQKLNTSLKGANGGLAELDQNGKVPSAQLPAYVDDILEYDGISHFPATGETGKIYVDTATNLTYRWTGTQYIEISQSLALGETSSTAFYGDKGKVAWNHAIAKGNQYTEGLWVISTNAEGHVVSARQATKADIGLGNVDNTADIDKPSSAATRQSEQNAANSATNAENYKIDSEAWAVGTRQGVDVGPSDETYHNSSKYHAQAAEAAKDVILGMRAEATSLPVGTPASASYANGLLSLGLPTGATGAGATITGYDRSYQNGTSGTEVPTGTWSNTRIAPVQGQYMWYRTIVHWNDGSETLLYTASYQGQDGSSGAESRITALENRMNNLVRYDAENEKIVITTGTGV